MKSLLRFSFYLIFLIIIQACTKIIDIDLPEHDEKIIVNSFFTDGRPVMVHLSKSISVLENSIPLCENAFIQLSENNTVIDTLNRSGDYYYSDVIPEVAKDYSLNISVPGMDSVICRDIIPVKTILQSYVLTKSVMTNEDGFVINELQLNFHDSAGPNFYEVELTAETLITEYNMGLWFMKNSDPIITSTGLLDYDPKTLIFSDKMFDGKSCSVKVYFAIQSGEPDYRLKVIFRSVSESYFRYKEKQFAYLFSLETDIFSGMSEPIQLFSNITGGYGIFAGYSSDNRTIDVVVQ